MSAKFEVGKAYAGSRPYTAYVCAHRTDGKRPRVMLSYINVDGKYENRWINPRDSYGLWWYVHTDGDKEFVFLDRDYRFYADEPREISDAVKRVKEYHSRKHKPTSVEIVVGGAVGGNQPEPKPRKRSGGRNSKKGNPIAGIIIIVMIALLLRACVGG